jgi:hypothetical protein
VEDVPTTIGRSGQHRQVACGTNLNLQAQSITVTQHRNITMNAVLDSFGYRNIGFPV